MSLRKDKGPISNEMSPLSDLKLKYMHEHSFIYPSSD